MCKSIVTLLVSVVVITHSFTEEKELTKDLYQTDIPDYEILQWTNLRNIFDDPKHHADRRSDVIELRKNTRISHASLTPSYRITVKVDPVQSVTTEHYSNSVTTTKTNKPKPVKPDNVTGNSLKPVINPNVITKNPTTILNISKPIKTTVKPLQQNHKPSNTVSKKNTTAILNSNPSTVTAKPIKGGVKPNPNISTPKPNKVVVKPTVSSIKPDKKKKNKNKQESQPSGPCSCVLGQCMCCTGFLLDLFQQKACLRVNYIPEDFTFDYSLLLNNHVMYKNKISGKNPRPACIAVPRLSSMRLCAKFSNIYFAGRNMHMCMGFQAMWNYNELFSTSFDCIRMGAQGFAVVKPEDGGGIPVPGGLDSIIDVGDDIEDYDENVVRFLGFK